MRLMILSAAFASLMAFTAGVASAQYTPPRSVVEVTAVTSAAPGSTVTVSFAVIGVLDGSDQSPRHCQVSIASQPGSDATVTLVGPGEASLFTGSTPGPIVVRVDCSPDGVAEITVLVQTAPGHLAPRTVASTSSQAAAPAEAGRTSSGPALPVLAAIGVGAGVIVLAFAARRRTSSQH